MKIQVRLFSYLCDLIGKKENRHFFTMEMKEGATCDDLLRVFNFPPHIPLSIFINGKVREKNYSLQEGDEVSILPPIGGG